MTSGMLNVSGASLYGTPVVEIGHTSHLAWTHTVSTAQRYTLYQLSLVPGKPASYLVDGRAEPMTTQKVQVTVRGSGGRLSTVTRTLYRSRYGPVLAAGWTAQTAFAIRDANASNLRSVNEWLAMDQSESLTQLRAAQRTYQGIPFVNTIAVDTSGSAYFADASVVPHVTDQQAARCIDTPEGKAAYPAQTILDGSTSACQWGDDPDAIEPGIFAPSHDPQLTRTDYVTNSNDSAWLANPGAPITGYPRIFGDIGTERSLRTRLGLTMVAQRLAGADGLGARLHPAQPAGHHARRPQQQRRTRPRGRRCDVPRSPGPARQQREAGRRARSLRHARPLERPRRHRQPRRRALARVLQHHRPGHGRKPVADPVRPRAPAHHPAGA
jgi:acyl-homoserine-lactone acylase